MSVSHQSIEVRQWWIPAKLALRQVIQKLLCEPVEDPQCHVVAGSAFITIVQPESQEQVRLVVADAGSVGHSKRVCWTHHNVD